MTIQISRRGFVIAGAVVVILAAIAMIFLTSGSGEKPVAETPASADEIAEVAESESLRTCMTLWNGSGNEEARRTVDVMEASYASVTFSSLYPDKCLITVANPKLDLAAQYLEGDLEGETGEKFVSFGQVESGSASSLDPSVTEWNLKVVSEGSLWLKSDTEDPEF